MLRKTWEGPVVLLAGEGGKGPASLEGSHYLENLHACIFLPSVRNPSLAYQHDRFEHFQHKLFLMFLPQRPELSAALMSAAVPHPPPAPAHAGTDSQATLHHVSILWTASHWMIFACTSSHNPGILNGLPLFYPERPLRDIRIKSEKNKQWHTGRKDRRLISTNNHIAPPNGRCVSYFYLGFK